MRGLINLGSTLPDMEIEDQPLDGHFPLQVMNSTSMLVTPSASCV